MTNDAECWDCGAVFNPLVAFYHDGCPGTGCDADLDDLFNQRSGDSKPDPERVQIQRNHDGSVEVGEA